MFALMRRFFRTDRLSVQKRISPWSSYEAAWGVEFSCLQSMYSQTRLQAGLVHAADGGPTISSDKYTVELGPVGLQRGDARPVDEEQAKSAAHGLLHGLQSLHEVSIFQCAESDFMWHKVHAGAEICSKACFRSEFVTPRGARQRCCHSFA